MVHATTDAEKSLILHLGPYVATSESCTINCGESSVKVTPRSMDVLLYLAENSTRVISSEELLDRFWSPVASDHAVHKAIAELRHALGDSARSQRYIKTIPKRGYRLLVPARESDELATSSNKATAFTRLRTSLEFIDVRRWLVAIGALLITNSLLFFALNLDPATTETRTVVLAVEPFQVQGMDEEVGQVATRSMYLNLLNVLADLPELRVRPETESAILPDLDQLENSSRGMIADYRLAGSMVQNGSNTRIFMNLVRDSNRLLEFSLRFDVKSSNLLTSEDRIVTEVVEGVRLHIESAGSSRRR